MSRRSLPFAAAFLVALGAATVDSPATHVSAADRTASPLDAYLGLDPETGEPAKAKPKLVPMGAEREPSSPSRRRGDTDAVADSREAFQRLADELGGGNAGGLLDVEGLRAGGLDAELLHRLTGGGDPSAAIETVKRILLALHLPLLAIPLGILIGELIGWLGRRRDETIDRFDRRHHRRRTLLRLGQAIVWTLMIALSAYGTDLGIGVGAAMIPLGIASLVGLALIVAIGSQLKRLDRGYLVEAVRQVRHQQAELRQDIEELNRRLGRSDTQAASVTTTAGRL